MRQYAALSIIFFTLLLTAQSSYAQKLICTQAYYPTEDTFVRYVEGLENNPDYPKQFGTVPYSYVGNLTFGAHGGGAGLLRAYMKFDLSDFNFLQIKIKNININLLLRTPYGPEKDINHGTSGPINKIVFNRVISDWNENTLIWDNQPLIDSSVYSISDVIPGKIGDPSFDDLEFNLNNILISTEGKLIENYGICARHYNESLYNYYRKIGFASTKYSNPAYWPTLKIEYQFPKPQIKVDKVGNMTVDVHELKQIFAPQNITYTWLVNGMPYEGNSILLANKSDTYNIELVIVVTNLTGDKYIYKIDALFENREEKSFSLKQDY